MASHSIEHTWVCHFRFHFISTLPSGWWPQSPPGNLHTSSHGYPRLSDRRLLRADGHWLWVRQRLGDMGVAQHSAASFSPPPKTLNIDTHTHTHTHTHTQKCFSLDPAWFWPWQRTHNISNITNATTTMLTFFKYQPTCQPLTYEALCIWREGNTLPKQSEFSFSDPIQTWLFGPSLFVINVIADVPMNNLRSILKFQVPGSKLKNADSGDQALDPGFCAGGRVIPTQLVWTT